MDFASPTPNFFYGVSCPSALLQQTSRHLPCSSCHWCQYLPIPCSIDRTYTRSICYFKPLSCPIFSLWYLYIPHSFIVLTEALNGLPPTPLLLKILLKIYNSSQEKNSCSSNRTEFDRSLLEDPCPTLLLLLNIIVILSAYWWCKYTFIFINYNSIKYFFHPYSISSFQPFYWRFTPL